MYSLEYADESYVISLDGDAVYLGHFAKKAGDRDLYGFNIRVEQVRNALGYNLVCVRAEAGCTYGVELTLVMLQVIYVPRENPEDARLCAFMSEPVYVVSREDALVQYEAAMGDFPVERCVNRGLWSVTLLPLMVCGVLLSPHARDQDVFGMVPMMKIFS